MAHREHDDGHENHSGHHFLFYILPAFLVGIILAGAVSSWLNSREPPEPVITTAMLTEQLQDAEKLVSVEYNYTNMGKFENHLDFYGWKVPFTTKSFIVSYDGTILAGVDLSRAGIEIDESAKAVSITLPSSSILSHEIDQDSLEVFDESKNIFNQISVGDFSSFAADQKSAVEARALNKGLLDSADEKAAEAVTALLTPLLTAEGYTLTVTGTDA